MKSIVPAALMLVSLRRSDEALQLLASDFDAGDPLAWYARAMALAGLGRHAEAARAAQDGLAVDAEHVGLLSTLASARLGLEDFAGAEDAILEALQLDPENANNLTHYAHIVLRVGQLDKAEQLVVRALSLDPENAFALQMHAILAAARNDRGALVERSRELLRVMPESTLGHQYMGTAHADAGRLDRALDHFVRAVQLDPADREAAEIAREAKLQAHWLLWPLRPLRKHGVAAVWIGAFAFIGGLRLIGLDRVAFVAAMAWFAYCVYSWIAPPLVRRLLR